MAASEMVASKESGIIVNEFYDQVDYVQRRAGWLGKHPRYARLPKLFPIARYDAQLVFAGVESDPLSVQEVRRRELAHGIDPLLPLPTTQNCLTLDRFASYSQREWTPGTQWPASGRVVDDRDASDRVTATAETSNKATVSNEIVVREEARKHYVSSTPSLALNQQYQTSQSKAIKSHMNFLKSPLARSQQAFEQTSAFDTESTANRGRDIDSRVQTSRRGTMNLNRSTKQSSSSSPMPRRYSSQYNSVFPSSTPTTPMVSEAVPTAGTMGPPQAPAANTVSGVDVPANQRRPAATLNLLDDDSVASLSGRGVSRPVKRRRIIEHDNNEIDDNIFINPESNGRAPQTAAQKQKRVAIAKKGTTHEQLNSEQDFAQPKSKLERSLPKTARLDALTSGTALPKSKAEAKKASTALQQHLLSQLPTTKSRSKRDPDLMPEFFNPANFPPSMAETSVRCVCGVTKDDNKKMIQCDRCAVWQHTKCMGEAVPADPESENAEYQCQVCDPWTHRKLVAKLRREASGN